MVRVASRAFFWAMIAGLAHVSVITVRHFVLGGFAWAPREYVWMTPLGYAVVFGVLAVPLMVVALALPRLLSPRLVSFVFAFFASLGVLLLFTGIHSLASIVVAAGFGVNSAARAGLPSRRKWGPGRAGLLIAASLATIGAGAALERRIAESLALASLGPPRDQAPNVLLIILDTVRAANTSLLGYHRETTPELSRLGDRGVVFEQAYTTSPWSLPSHAGLFTGRYASEVNADWEVPLDKSSPTVAEVFRAGGYATAGFVGNRYYAAWESGLDRGFLHYDDGFISFSEVLLTTTFRQTPMMMSLERDPSAINLRHNLRYPNLRIRKMPYSDLEHAGRVTADFLEWQRRRGDRPFFAFINLFDAHARSSPTPRRFAAKPEEEDRYDAAIFYMDSIFGGVVDSLEARGLLENTIIVVTSDHGEALGEHGFIGHGKSLYRTELHVPLLVSFPATVPGGVRVTKPVSLRDLPSTLLDLAGLNVSSLPGQSLRPTWTQKGASASLVISSVKGGWKPKPPEPIARGPMQSLIDDSTHLIVNGDGVEELFSWREDPLEKRDLADIEDFSPTLSRMRTRLLDALRLEEKPVRPQSIP